MPKIRILATGGTIAGLGQSATPGRYAAAKVGVEALIGAAPGLEALACVSGEQVAEIGSQDMDDALWLKLSARVRELLARQDVDGIVITHGTDTLEETAYFLELTLRSDKPVVLTGAMRPFNAMGADGPANLYGAVAVAAGGQSRGRGVLVAMNNVVLDARDACKCSTTEVQAFASPNSGPLGLIHNGQVRYQRAVPRAHATQPEFDAGNLQTLPLVGIVYNHANASELPVKALVAGGFRGIVSAGMGNGNLHHSVMAALAEAAGQGVVVVRSSRVPTGATTPDAEVDDRRYGFVAAGTLNPQKARVLLQLALTKTDDPVEIQRMFRRCG